MMPPSAHPADGSSPMPFLRGIAALGVYIALGALLLPLDGSGEATEPGWAVFVLALATPLIGFAANTMWSAALTACPSAFFAWTVFDGAWENTGDDVGFAILTTFTLPAIAGCLLGQWVRRAASDR